MIQIGTASLPPPEAEEGVPGWILNGRRTNFFNGSLMKIFLSILENLKTVPMNQYIYKTLLNMGHEVFIFGHGYHNWYGRIIKKISQEKLVNYVDKKTMQLIEKFKPDLFFTIYGFNHSPEVINKIKSKGIPTLCWWLNDPFQFERSVAKAIHYDLYFTNSKKIIDSYKERGMQNVFHLPPAIFPDIHRKIHGLKNKYDICFAGDHKSIRESILEALVEEFNITLFGPWRKKIKEGSSLSKCIKGRKFFTPQEMVMIFNQSKVVLNIHTWFGKYDHGINPRVFEANGCGVFQVCDWKEEISDFYIDGKEIIIYRNIEELKEKLRYYSKNDAARQKIAENGYIRTHNEHTYGNRLNELMRICKNIT